MGQTQLSRIAHDYSNGAIASIVYPSYTNNSSPTVNYTYNGLGEMNSVTDFNSNKITFSYDSNGNLINQSNNVTSSNLNGTSNINTAYDLSNNVNLVTANVNATTSSISPQVVSAPSLTNSPPKTTANNPVDAYFNKTAVNSSKITTTSTCSPTTAVLTLAFANNNNTSDQIGSRDLNSNVTQEQDHYVDNCSNSLFLQRNYSYDLSSQVTYEGSTPQGTSPNTFAYDSNGNPTLMLNNTTGYNQSFDSAGEITSQVPTGSSGSTTTYEYSSLGTLSKTTSGSVFFNWGTTQTGQLAYEQYFATQNTYYYNGDNNEVGVSIGSNPPQERIWDNTISSLPLLISDSNDYFIYGPNNTVVEQYNITSTPPSSNPTFMYYVQDNSAWIITNLNGQLTNFYRYDAYGNLTNGSAGSVFGYAAQYQDTSTLYDMRARFYSPNTGLFIQRDPMYNQTDQAYAYAGGNPVNGSDPSGMCTIKGAEGQVISSNSSLCQNDMNAWDTSCTGKYSSTCYQPNGTAWSDPYNGSNTIGSVLQCAIGDRFNVNQDMGCLTGGAYSPDIQFIKWFESIESTCSSNGSWCYVQGNCQIGYGNDANSQSPCGSSLAINGCEHSPPLSQTLQYDLLVQDLEHYGSQVQADFPGMYLSQNQMDALVSFGYNLGVSYLSQGHTLADYIRSGGTDSTTIASDFELYDHPISDPGLLRRRYDESQIYLYGNYTTSYP